MATDVIMFGWNRSIPGRERASAAHFDEFVGFLGESARKGTIASFDAVFLDAHGGDLNGFFLIRGEAAALNQLVSSTEWITHITRATLHLEGAGVIRGVTGDEIGKRMAIWTSAIPS